MCGICAYIGFSGGYSSIYHGLKMLQNRGYDSAGICGMSNSGILEMRKYASLNNKTAIQMLSGLDDLYADYSILIAHSRWACQGGISDINAHPHTDYQNNFALVHNGIIENYEQIRDELFTNYGIISKTQTDSEVIANLISYYYNRVKNTELAIKLALDRLEGTWGLVIINKNEPNKLFCARHGSPLLIGFSRNSCMIVSEQSGFDTNIEEYICLNDNDIIILDKEYESQRIIFDKKSNYKIKKVLKCSDNLLSPEYPYWTIKEICEQPIVVSKSICNKGRILNDYMVKLGGLEQKALVLSQCEHLVIIGCGTSYNAGRHVLPIFKQLSQFNTCQVFDGGEFSLNDIPKSGRTCIILLSQSGETRDLYQALSLVKNNDQVTTVGVINVIDSLIAREVDCGVYLYAGREVGVASTKVFVAQVIVLYMISIFMCQIKDNNLYIDERKSIIRDIFKLKLDISNTIASINKVCQDVAVSLCNKKTLFILGKGQAESICQEGALKIKEIGYIHAEGYSSTALKHGPYSLIEPGTPIIIINLNDDNKTSNNIITDEIKARDAFIIKITDYQTSTIKEDIVINISHNDTFRNLLAVIPMQLIAYYRALFDDRNPDLPRNLAKTVTVC